MLYLGYPKKNEFIYSILHEYINNGEEIFSEGILEILSNGFGFLRSPENNYLASVDDIYVSPSQIKKFSLILNLKNYKNYRLKYKKCLLKYIWPNSNKFFNVNIYIG